MGGSSSPGLVESRSLGEFTKGGREAAQEGTPPAPHPCAQPVTHTQPPRCLISTRHASPVCQGSLSLCPSGGGKTPSRKAQSQLWPLPTPALCSANCISISDTVEQGRQVAAGATGWQRWCHGRELLARQEEARAGAAGRGTRGPGRAKSRGTEQTREQEASCREGTEHWGGGEGHCKPTGLSRVLGEPSEAFESRGLPCVASDVQFAHSESGLPAGGTSLFA